MVKATIRLLGFVLACDSSVEVQDGGGGGAATVNPSEPPEPQTCEEFCDYMASFGCWFGACTSCDDMKIPQECLEQTKALWACMVQNYHPKQPNGEGCGAPECFEVLVELQECEDAL